MLQSHSSKGIKFQMFSFWPPFFLVSTSHINLLCEVQQGTCFETGALLHQSPTRAAAALPVFKDPSDSNDCTWAFCTTSGRDEDSRITTH